MRTLVAAVALACASAFGGCALFQATLLTTQSTVECGKVPAALLASCNKAVDVIEKSSVLLAAVNTTVDNGLLAGTLLKAQALAYRAKTKKADVDLDTAYDSLVKLDIAGGLTQANLVNDALVALQKEVAAEIAAKGAK